MIKPRGGSSRGSSSSPILVDALWDKENAELPVGYRLQDLRSNIEQALKNHNTRFVLDKLRAYGPNLVPGINQHGIENVCIPKETIACQAKFPDPNCLKLVVENPNNNNEVRTMRCTDIADRDLIMDLCLQLGKDMKKPILIIAGDKDYLTCIEGFPDAYLMLAESKNPNHELHVKTKATWTWAPEDEEEQQQTMVFGGKPRYVSVAGNSIN